MKVNLLTFAIFFFACSRNIPTEKVYFNGRIWTGDKKNPHATAIYVKDSTIVFVGSDAEAVSRAQDGASKIDLEGKFVTPGFIDNHVHFISGGLHLSRIDLSGATSKNEFQHEIAKNHEEIPDGEWMQGGNWDHEKWGGVLPDITWIDEVASDRPIILDRLDGHMAVANSYALNLAGIDETTNDPPGGLILRDDSGKPTGILKDKAINLCKDLIPEESDTELDRALNLATDHAISFGVTQVHDMGSWRDLEVYHRNYKSQKLRIRIKIYPWYSNWEEIINYVGKNGPGNDWLKWNGVKGMIDGSLGSKTAWMHSPYLYASDSHNKEHLPTFGIVTLEDTTNFKHILRQTDANSIQHAVHAIGDKANDWILNQFADIRAKNGDRDRRSRVEHAQHLSPLAITRFAKENIIPSMQPYHLFDDGSWAHTRVRQDVLRRTYVFKTLIESGANLTFGSDWTVAPLDPVQGIFAAVTRKTRDLKHSSGWYPSEKISVEEALRSYTINNAYAAYWEKTTGSIESGKNADFVVHSENLLKIEPDSLLQSKVLRTVIAGKDYLFE